MAGTKAGGIKARDKNLALNPNFYAEIGRKGGQNGHTGGFASDVVGEDGLTGRERARIAGSKGGKASTRKGVLNGQGKTHRSYEVEEKLDKDKTLWERFFKK